MAIYDDTVKKYKQYLKDAQIEALMEKSRQYNRENAGNRADAVSQARSSYDTAYRGLQNMGLAGAKGTELTGEVPRLKTNIAGQFNRVNAQLYNREQQAVEALGGQYAAQTKAQQAAAAAARAAAESQAEAEEAAKRNAVGGLVTGAVSAALAGQTKQTKQTNANTATLIPSKGQRIGMETAAKTRGTGGMVTAATAAAIAQQEFEQKKALAAMQALGIRRSKFASSPTQKTAAQTTVNALQSSLTAQQEYLSAMEMLRRAQAGAQKDPRAGSGVAYYADRVGEILSNATIPTEQRVQMAMEYLQADVDEKTSPLADRKAKEIIASAYGLKVPKSDETFDALDKARRSKTGNLGYGVGATYDKDAEIAFRQEQSNRAEYDYFIPAIANSIRYAGKKAEPEKGVNNDIYAIINGYLTSNYLTLAERKNNLPTPYEKKMQKFEFLTDEEKNAYNWLYKNKGLDKANEYAESLTPFLLERNNAYTQEEWTKVANKSWVGASILSVPMAIGEVPAAIKKMGLGLYNTVSKDAKYIDTNDPTETMSTIRSTIRSASSQKILGLDKENHEPTKAQKFANFVYSAGMSTADSAFLGLMGKFGGWRGITDTIFFSSSFGDKYKEARASGANQQQAFNAAVASGAAETIFEHVSLDTFLENFLSAPLKGATRIARFVEMLKKIGLQGLVEGSEEMFTGIANLFTDQLFLGELSENAKNKAAYIQEALADGLSQKDAEKQADKRVVAETIQNIGMETLAGALSGGMFGIFGAGMNKVHFSEMGRRLRGDTSVYDQVIQNAKMLGGETAEMARNIEQAGSKATDSAIGELYNASYEATRKLLETDNRDTAAVLLAGEKITESQAEGMLEESGDVLKEAGYDTSSADALAASYNQRVEEVATAQKEAFDNRARDYNIKRAEEVYTDKEALRNVPLTLPTGVSPVQFAEAERSNFKSRTTIQSDGVELQLSLMDMDGRFTNEQKLERARKAMTAQAQRKLDMIGKISKALGMDVVVHDYMRGSNGYFGEDGKIHFVLSGHMSVARVAAHELTHQMQSVASEKYTVVRDQLIEDVGQDRFDRLLKRKAAQYGYNMESEQGRLACDEEVIAELCEGMLSDKDRLERFAERHTDTALTLKERLTKILNAIHATLKDTFGQNQNRISDMITDEKTADKWLDGLDEVLKKVQEKQAQENKSAIQYRIDETGMSAERKAEYDEYIQNALGGPGNNNEIRFTIGKVDARIAKWLERFGKKISSDAVHVIADNDVRHIRNRHGIAKEGQYGVTTGDLQAIPYILKNANEKYFFPKPNGKSGILYVTDGVDTTYYVEEIISEDALTGKQMIKTKKGTVPSAYENIINNKEAFLAPPDNAADAVPEMYVQDARQYYASTDKISQADKSVKGKFSLDTDSGNLQAELYELKNQRKEMLEADEAYRKASEQRRYANTFAERVAASRALREAQEKIDTAEIDRKISKLQDRISKMREEEVRKHQEEKEKYAGTKTAGYSMEPDTRLKSLDAPYMEAVKSGNKSKAQKLVQQAAEAAMPKSVVRDSKGKLLKTYHYTNSNFTAFDRSTARTGNEMDGFFFAPDAESTREYGKRQIVAYLNITNLAVDPVLDRKFDDSGTLLREKLAAQGYDGVARTENGKIYEYMVFDPEQIKLADAVTYDDAGNAIPLSERFNMGKKDIRYSLDTDHYDYSRSFAQQIDDYVAGKFPERDTFVLGKTPDIYQKVGLSALPMTMDQIHVDYALNGTKNADHQLGAALLKQLPTLMEKPVAIIESATHPNNSVMAIVKGEVNGKQVTAAVRVGGTGVLHKETIDSNHVVSVQGRQNAVSKLLVQAMEKENAGETGVYYINKTEAQDLCARAGLQLPGSAAQDGLIHSIFDAGSPVNRKYMEQTETRQFKRWFGDSKVVNADGTPMKVYHQTENDFTVFDPRKGGAGSRDEGTPFGIFLKRSPRDIGLKGKKQMELYVSIENPLRAANREDFSAKMRKMSPEYDTLIKEHEALDAEYKAKNREAKDALVDFMVQWRKDNPGADSRALYEVEKFNELFDAEDTLLDEWTAKADAISVKAKEALTSALEKNGYDGVILETDEGSWGRKTDAYIALRPEQVKSATDNIGTFDRNNPDIRYSLDTEQLEKTVRAIDTKALEEGLQSMTLTSNVNSFTMKDPSRFFDAISKNNTELRDELHDIFEKPHSEATGKYARGIKDMQERVRNIATEAGILSKDGKKFDKAASAAVQNYGEGYQLKKCTVEAKVVDADTVFINAVSDGINVLSGDFTLQEVRKNFGRENGDMIWEKAFDQAQKNSERGQKASAIEYESTTSPYKLTDLQTQFPRTWQKLVEADKAFREMYDEYIGNMNAMLREIYPNSFTKEDDTVAKIDDLVEKKKHRITDTEKAIAERMKSLGKVEAEMAAKKRTDTKAYDTLRRRQTALNEAIADLNEKKAGYNEDIAALAVKKNAIFELDKSGESLNRMHQLEYRQDYYHHFNEMSVGLKEAWNLILQGSNRDISPAVVGNTANSKAKTRWAGFFQQRKGGAYTADAVNGMLKYGALAEYKLAFDPLVAYLRDAEKKIRDVSDETNRNSLILYLNSWTNQIAGKSSDFDRLLTDRGVVGRNILNLLQKLNGRVIRNTLYFNARSAIVQISNISNAVSLVTNPKDWKNGVLCWSKAAKGDEMMQNIMSQSNFLASRFAGVEMMDTSTMAKAEKFANWMLSIADTISAKATWWAAYNQYVRDPNSKSIMSMPRGYESAVDYADDVTRRTHGGRGVGEKAPIMTSKLVSFFAPFQLEVNNTYQLLKENIKKKNALGIATMEATVFVMNAVFEAVVGSTILPFDFVRALIDIIFGAKDIQDDDDDDHKLASTFKLIGQRLGAETVSGLPYAGMIPQFLGEDTTEAVFGETDMTKYGNVNMGVGGAVGIGKVLASLAKWGAEGVKPDWFSMVNELSEVLPPIGGKQIARTIGGLTTVAQGYSGKTNSKGEDTVQFATDTNVLNYIHAGIFGKWALTEASEYFGEDRILPKLFGYYNGESASTGSPVKAEEFQAARALGLSGKGYFTIRKELKEYRTQEGKRSSLYTTNLTPAQKAGMDALLISTSGTSSEAKSEGAIVYGRTKQEDGSWGEWKVKADYSSEDLFKLSLYGDTKYSAGTTAMKNGAGIKNVLGLLDTVDAYNDANENPMTATQKRDWLRENVKDTKQAALLDAYILSKNKSTNVKVEGNVVYTMSLGEDGKPSVTKDGTVAEWKVKADYTDDTWYAISRHGDSKYRKGLTAVRKGANPKTIRKYLDDMQAYQDSKNQSMSFEERGQWIRKNGGTPKEQAILDAYMLRKDSNTDAKVKDGIVYTLELGEDGKPKVYKSGSVAEWKVKADYTSDEWYAVSQTDHYDKAKTAYSACGIKPTVFVDFYAKWSDLSAKDAFGKTVSGLKKKRTKELLDKMKISTEQKAYLYYKVCGYK